MSGITMSRDAYQKFLKFVIRHAAPNQPRHTWQEVIGFLFGKFGEESDEFDVYITDVLPMDSGSSVYVKIGDYTPIYPMLTEKLELGEFICGWIHSHPGLSIFMSGTDVNTQKLYEAVDKRAIAIVVDHTKIRTNFPGLEAFRLKNNKEYQSIPLRIEEISNFEVNYQELVNELEIYYPVAPFPVTSLVELDQIRLRLEGPAVSNPNESYQIFLFYESEQEGFVQIEYVPKIEGKGQIKSMLRSKINHSIYEPGILAIFQVQTPDVQRNDHVYFYLRNLRVVNKDGEQIIPEKLSFATRIV